VRSSPPKADYETGMKVVYDRLSKRVVVSFRGRITVLPESFEQEAEAVKAGENYCKQHGWVSKNGKSRSASLRGAWG
jgi:hypothetical protein